MKIFWFFVVLQTALAQTGFGTSYLKNSRLCHQWSCINSRLGLTDSLPAVEEFGSILRGLLPAEWHGVVQNVLETCYHNRPRRYTGTCPGQAILHCAVDQLNVNCPEAYLNKDDACAPVNSLAGFNNMFTQSRYENMEKNIGVERRPAWFLRNYFNRKCCNLPTLFNSTTLSECGFVTVMQYYNHNPVVLRPLLLTTEMSSAPTKTPVNNGDSLHVISLSDLQGGNTQTASSTPANNGDSLEIVSLNDFKAGNTQLPADPLDCCNISDFIQPSWRQECGFQLSWEGQGRLVVKQEAPATSTEALAPTSTASPVTRTDVTIVPHSCEEETCVFNKLNILSPSGTVDLDAFTKLLDNFTTVQPSWTSAKGRVVTTCLTRPISEYGARCEINKLLACTFDVLTENCPYSTRNDLCKHSMSLRTCQISSSKYRPKHRREICALPELVDRKILSECGLTSLGKMEPVTSVVRPKTYRLSISNSKCQDLTPSTTCLMSKMDVLNKYGFMDYFKMKDRIRNFASINERSALENALNYGPFYREHCNSPKKFLNVIESILLTCPNSKKKDTVQCASIFNEIKNTAEYNRSISHDYSKLMLNHFFHVFNYSGPPKVWPKHVKKAPVSNYWILNSNNAPKVTTIDIKPKVKKLPLVEKPPVVLLPVYMRVPHSNLLIRPFSENGVMRSPFSLHNQIAQAHIPFISTTSPNNSNWPVSTTQPISTARYISTTRPVSTTTQSYSTARPISTRYTVPKMEDKFEMIKPE